MNGKRVLAPSIVLLVSAFLLGPLTRLHSGNQAHASFSADPKYALSNQNKRLARHESLSAAQQSWPPVSLTPLASGLELPLHITHSGDGSGRVFVIEQRGRIRIIRSQSLVSRPFLAIEGRVISGGEQGLLSVAFPPGYNTKRYFYVDYTRQPDGATVISRFRLTADPDQADAGSEEIILTIPQPFANHNGGLLAFGPLDGYLYIGMGDGGSGGDPNNNAQNPNSLLGKILRIDVESGTIPYAIPPSNPYVSRPEFRPEVWALGLRNPWRYSFDRMTGDLYIADVGQGSWEEIDFRAANAVGGRNFGWRILEGAHCYNPPSGCVAPEDYSPPVAEYDHSQGCSVTGGFVYRGTLFPSMQGIYFYGDYCSGRIWGLRLISGQWETTQLLTTSHFISSFGEDEAGNLYLSDLTEGTVYALKGDPAPSVTISSPAGGAAVTGTILVQATASDNGTVTRVELSVDDALLATDVAPPYSFDWDTTKYPNGIHRIKATAYDDLGQPNSHEISVNVGNVGTYSLNIGAGAGGTTNPPPGTYVFDKAATVTIAAVPGLYFGFRGWTGDAAGRANPIIVSLDAPVKSVTADFVKIQAPSGATVQQVINRSLSQAEYINVLRWQPNPANENIVGYRIYLVSDAGRALIAALDADTFIYWHRRIGKNSAATYALAAVNDEGREGEAVVVRT